MVSTLHAAAFIQVSSNSFIPSRKLRHISPSVSLHHSSRRITPNASLGTALVAAAASFSTLFNQPHHNPIPQFSSVSTTTNPSDFMNQKISNRRVNPHRAFAVVDVPTVPSSNPLGGLVPKRTDGIARYAGKVSLLVGLAAIVIIAGTISVFWVIQDSLVYKPVKIWRGSPKASGMPYYDDVNYCTVDGVEISGWFIRQPPERFANARTLVYFHGTDKNASFRLKKVIGFYETCQCNVLLLSYRGYGLSTGKPNEKGFRIDAESAYDYLESRGDVDVGPGGHLWVYGESLGGAVAIYFSNIYQHCINALILENTFTSLLDMIKLEFPMLGVFRYLSRNRWQSKKRIGDLNIPLLFLSGLKDRYIPPQMMKTMHALATKSPLKELVTFEKGTHNQTWAMDGFYETVAAFMDRVESRGMDGVGSASGTSRDEGNRVATA